MSAPLGRLADIVEFSCVDGPGNRFVVFLQGCNFDCVACHNPQTIAATRPEAREVTVAELLDRIRPLAPYLRGVTVSGGEATRQAGFVHALFSAIKADPELNRLSTFVDSNGATPPGVWSELAPVMDAAMIDLKALDPTTHRALTGRSNDAVLRSIELLAQLGKLHEVRLLLVPGFNDSIAVVEQTAAWLHSVAPTTSIKVIGFRSHGTRPPAADWEDEPREALEAAERVMRECGFCDVVVV